jgi:hypothetical protein
MEVEMDLHLDKASSQGASALVPAFVLLRPTRHLCLCTLAPGSHDTRHTPTPSTSPLIRHLSLFHFPCVLLQALLVPCRLRSDVACPMRLEARAVAPPSLDAVKMEDRKRPSGHDDTAPPAKRQAVTANGARPHPDADMPWKDDIEVRPPDPLPPPLRCRFLIPCANPASTQAYQKDAILRQMREYKREKATIESQLNEMEFRSKHHDDHLRTIDAWFDQVSFPCHACSRRMLMST